MKISNTKLYYIYHSIKTRCYNKKANNYKYYGGRGITMCDEWYNDFKVFQSWAYSNGYTEGLGLSIDRKDVNGNYEPSNCRWATNKEQQNNRTDNHYLTYKGKTQTLAQWSEELNINRQTLKDRIYRSGWTIDKAFTTPVKQNKKYIAFEGKTLTIAEWCKELDVERFVISDKLLKGWEFEDIVTFIRNRS